jgi:uncharacterized lipoprotein YddW (UPF0748 family)
MNFPHFPAAFRPVSPIFCLILGPLGSILSMVLKTRSSTITAPFSMSFTPCRLAALFLLAIVVLSGAARAQAPSREVRAVWITTLLGLDWPKSTDRAEQQRSLGAIVRDLARARYNTIYFQVRGRGDAMYRSRFEPWSAQLTGTPGKDPGWDPLEFLVREAHAEGIEVHAWFNAVKVGAVPSRRDPVGPLYVTERHAEWARQADGEWWLDPGNPQVRAYILQVGLDIVRRYDIDGFQLDFIRYPAAPFADDETYRRYGAGTAKDDWRRANITRLVASFHDSVLALKPQMKLGAAPLGVYRNNGLTRGLQAYDETYQDAPSWIAKGLLDYIAPQVYWSLGDRPGNPDFARVAKEWIGRSAGRQVVVGIAPYKPEVAAQLAQIIDVTRRSGASGQSFFRYSNVAGSPDVASRYDGLALPPAMRWKDAAPPEALAGCEEDRAPGGAVTLRWRAPAGDAVRAAIYRSAPGAAGPGLLVAVRPADGGLFVDTSEAAREARYAVTLVDRAGNESAPTAASAPAVAAEPAAPRPVLGETVLDEAAPLLFVPYELGSTGPVVMTIVDEKKETVGTLVRDVQEAGRYVAAAEVGPLRSGWYTVVLTAGTQRQERRFRLE